LAATSVNLAHFTEDGFNLTMAGWSLRAVHVPTGTRLPLGGDTINALVRETAAPGRYDSYEGSRGELAARLRQLGIRSEVGAPVVVDGQVWGALIAGTDEPQPLPVGAEDRLARFAELIATAVSNATARSELLASRARIVEAADEQRRRVVRDLHDGAQQRLIHAVMTLQLARAGDEAPPALDRLVGEALDDTRAAIEELRELARGLHPAVLTHRGLAAAIDALADRAPVPVNVDIPEQRYPASVESAAYFIAAEALTNVAKYAKATTARITASRSGDSLLLTVEDDGGGGATPSPGSGLSGLQDRVAALARHADRRQPTRRRHPHPRRATAAAPRKSRACRLRRRCARVIECVRAAALEARVAALTEGTNALASSVSNQVAPDGCGEALHLGLVRGAGFGQEVGGASSGQWPCWEKNSRARSSSSRSRSPAAPKRNSALSRATLRPAPTSIANPS
jgi:signal transduction histidine kinase